MNPTEKNTANKEKLIMTAAEEEFFRKGYDGASTAVIAKAAGVTHAMVNYYFRTKENLFIQILDSHIHELVFSIKPLMNKDTEVKTLMTEIALAIFDRMSEDRKFPFILQDTARTHPEFLIRYRKIFIETCMDSIQKHTVRLDNYIKEGKLAPCTMDELGDTLLTLTTAPFLNIPFLTNVLNISEDKINNYLIKRREEIKRIIIARYGR